MKVSSRTKFARVLAGATGSVDLMVEMEGPEMPEDVKRPPLRIVAVLDCSGSMNEYVTGVFDQGGNLAAVPTRKIDQLKRTMHKLVDNLTDNDELSVVWFESGVHVWPFRKMSATSRKSIKTDIDEFSHSGGTNIAAALDATVLTLTRDQSKDGVVPRVFLLTDGQPTDKDTSTEGLVRRVAKLPEGVGLSCFGYGDRWGEGLLSAMSKQGKGNLYFVDNLSSVSRFFATELGGLLTMYARDVVLSVRTPSKDLVTLNDCDIEVEHEGNGRTSAEIHVGEIGFEETRRIVLRLDMPASTETGRIRLADIGVTYEDLGSGDTTTIENESWVECVEDASGIGAADREVAQEVAVLEAAKEQIRAKEMADNGNIVGAQNIMMAQVNCLMDVGGDYANGYADVLRENAADMDHYTLGTAKRMVTASAFVARSKSGAFGSGATAMNFMAANTSAAKKKAAAKIEDEDEKP